MITHNPALGSKFSKLMILSVATLVTGCLGSAPKRDNSTDFLHSKFLSQSQDQKKTQRITDRLSESLFQGSADFPNEINCHDKVTSGSYSEDMNAECVRSQTLKAYEAFELKIDPEIPYCVLRQETSNVKNNNDPYDVNFDRLAVCGGNGKKYCGIGLAQITFGTWAGYDDILRRDADKNEKFNRCLNSLSAATNQPRTYQFVTFSTVNSSNIEKALFDAKTKAPADQLSPLYRDHAICLNALHISELKAANQSARGHYAVKGKGKKRHKVYLSSSLNQAERIGSAYNGGGTKGYGAKISQCVAGFRNYDQVHQASSDSYYLKSFRAPASELAMREKRSEINLLDRSGHNL